MANPNPNPPKRKKASAASRKTRGNKNKRTRYDYAGAREALSLPSDATTQEIAFNVTPASASTASGGARSPLKKQYKYKAMLLEERSKNDILAKKFGDSVQDLHLKERKISSLKNEVRQLSDSLRAEKEKSRLTILKLIDDVEDAIAAATVIKEDTNEKMSAVELAIFREKEKSQNAIQREREYTSYAISSRKLNSNYLLIYISTELIS